MQSGDAPFPACIRATYEGGLEVTAAASRLIPLSLGERVGMRVCQAAPSHGAWQAIHPPPAKTCPAVRLFLYDSRPAKTAVFK